MKKCKSKTYITDIVVNKNAHRAANKEYQLLYVETAEGFRPCLLTAVDLNAGFKRASHNKEDVKPMAPEDKLTWWQSFLAWFA